MHLFPFNCGTNASSKLKMHLFNPISMRSMIRRPTIRNYRLISVLVESTPNPCSRKFVPGSGVRTAGEDVKASPLYHRLLKASPAIDEIFYGPDFITVSTGDANDWDCDLEQAIEGEIAAFLDAGLALFPETDAQIDPESESSCSSGKG